MENSQPSVRMNPARRLAVAMLVLICSATGLVAPQMLGCAGNGSLVLTPAGVQIELWQCPDTGEVTATMPGEGPPDGTSLGFATLKSIE